MNVVVRRTRLKGVDERIAAEGGVQRGLGERHVAFCECGLIGHKILRRRLIET
jgi:hypothetical protein